MQCNAHGWRYGTGNVDHVVDAMCSKTAKALFAIEADRRWILTGTPVQNQISELYSFFRFLCYAPYDDMAEWKARIERVCMGTSWKAAPLCLVP
jgi:SNF2 family DNA or RNA helicase